MIRFILLVLVCLPSLAIASPGDPEAGSIAVAVNSPTSWLGISHAASAYVGVAKRHAIRVNVARYNYGWGSQLYRAIGGDYDSGTDHTGNYFDVGVSWLGFAPRLHDGAYLELGLLRRARHTIDTDRQNEYPAYLEVNTTRYAARVGFGISFAIRGRAFIAVGSGISVGYERGTDLQAVHYMETPTSYDFKGVTKSAEMYLRFGAVLR